MAPKNTTEQKIQIPNREQILTVGDLADFREDLLSEINRMFKEHNGEPGKKWLKSSEIKKLLGISHGFLQQLRDSGTLPFIKIGGSIYYEVEDIQKMMLSHKLQKQDFLSLI